MKRDELFSRVVPSSRTLVAGVVIALVLAAMRILGLSVADIGASGMAAWRGATADTKAVMAGDYVQRTADRLREEAAALPPGVPDAHDNEDPRFQHDLLAERKRILEERADHLQKNGVRLMNGDTEGLKRQIEEYVRHSGGNY